MADRELIKKLKRLEIKTARLVQGAVSGGYLSTFKGRGIEFNEVREYTDGDDVRAIDWNVTARMGTPYIKTFVEERDMTVMLAVDLSASMRFGTVSGSKSDAALEFAAAVTALAVGGNDRVGLVSFSDRVESYVPPKKGRRHALRIIDMLASRWPSSGHTDLSVPAGFLLGALKTRASVFWVSDFIGCRTSGPLKALAMRHELIPVVLGDDRESGMPDVGIVELVDPETGERGFYDTSSTAFRDALDAKSRELNTVREKLFRSLKADHIELMTGVNPVLPLGLYFKRLSRKGARAR